MRSHRSLALALSMFTLAAFALIPGSAGAVTGAAFTTTNTNVDGTGHCKNGNEDINCNIYDGKQFVWLNGGPNVAYVGDGTYFFAVLAPGGQANPNDGTPKNLSDDFDTYTNRRFTVTGGTITSYGGSHDFANNKIRLAPYADTPNPGGVYILAICSLQDGTPVTPSKCKYDAFKIQEGNAPSAFDLTVVKDASGTYDKVYSWGLTKDVDRNSATQPSGSAAFQYTVKATRSAALKTNIVVVGTITVFNPNVDANGDTIPVHHVTVTDHLSNDVECVVDDAVDVTISTAEASFSYRCEFDLISYGQLNNSVTVTWEAQTLSNGAELPAGSANFIFTKIPFTFTKIDACAKITDVLDAGTVKKLGTPCGTKTFVYNRSIHVPTSGCADHTNVATLLKKTTGVSQTASKTVTVCKG
jgi:hypothetical protein